MVAQINIVILIQKTNKNQEKKLLCVANFYFIYIYTIKQNKKLRINIEDNSEFSFQSNHVK